MATLYSKGTGGNWSTLGTFNTLANGTGADTAPTAADAVIIQKNDVVILDTNTAGAIVALSVALEVGTTGADVGGILRASTTANSKIVVERNITAPGATGGSGAYTTYVDFNMSAAAGYTCEVVTNNSNTTGANTQNAISGNFNFKGAARTRHTTLTAGISAGATSATVADATGWVAGDRIIFATTSAYASPPAIDIITLDTVDTGTGAITWTGGATYAHATDCPVGNFSSNLILRPGTANGEFMLRLNSASGAMSADGECTHVEFRQCKPSTSGSFLGVLGWQVGNTRALKMSDNAFYDYTGVAIYFNHTVTPTERKRNIFHSSQTASNSATVTTGFFGPTTAAFDPGTDEDYVIFRGVDGLGPVFPGQHQIGHKISGCVGSSSAGDAAYQPTTPGIRTENCDFWSNNTAYHSRVGGGLSGCRFGDEVFSGCNNSGGILVGPGIHNATDCYPQSGSNAILQIAASNVTGVLNLYNRDGDSAVQEVYKLHSNTAPVIDRSVVAAEYTRSTSALRMTLNGTAAIEHEISVPVKAGEAAKILVYVTRSNTNLPVAGDVNYAAAAYTEPSVTLSGLGITPVTASFSGTPGTFQLLTLDLSATPKPGPAALTSDGLLTLTLSAQSATAGAQAFFAGLPASPFVSRCRHYGYLFDETTLTRTANITVSAAEATAAAYTGMAVTWDAAQSDTAITTAQTFQKLYDYTQAQACLNVASALPLTGAGVAGSPALFAAGDITLTGSGAISGGGSLSMGAFVLTAPAPFAYTYTGGTFSQATTVPTFSGGTLNIGAADTYTYTQAAAMILSMTPSAPGTYALGDTAFTGEVDLRNVSGTHAITVELPTGTTYTTANNTGAAITVTLPVVTADISITGMPNVGAVPTRLQIRNTTAEAAAARANSTAYSVGDVRLRQTGVGTENTLGLYLRCTTGGTSAGAPPTWNTTVGGTTTDGTVVWTTYAVLYYDADPAGTSLADTYVDGEEFLAGEVVEVYFAEMNGATSFKSADATAVATSAGFSVLLVPEADPVYAIWAVDGEAQDTTFSPDYVATHLILDADTDFSGAGAFAYYCYLLTTSQGMALFWGGMTAIDPGNIRINTAVLSLYFNESAGFIKQTDNIRIFRDDDLRPAVDPTTGGHGLEMNWRTPVSVVSTGGSALTSTQDAKLMAIPTAAVTASATRTELTTELTRVTKLAALSGIDATLVVTPTTRTAGSVSQTIDTVGDTTTVSTV